MSKEGLSLKGKLIVGGIITLGSVALFFTFRHMWKKHQDQKGSKQAEADSQSALGALQNNGIKPSYSPAQFSNWANVIKQAMDGCGDGWVNTIQIWRAMKNDADIYALIVAYGTQTVDRCGWGNGDFVGDLSSTLAYKYSGAEMSAFVTMGEGAGSIPKINKILQANGVTFKF